MRCPVAHQYGQLQLELPGIRPLTIEELTSVWLEEVLDPWSAAALSGFLLVNDAQSRPRRVSRRQWLRSLQSQFREEGFGVVGGTEVLWLYSEAAYCYTECLDLAAILCAHAACERMLAGFLDLRHMLDSRGLSRAGLGPIAEAAFEAGFIDATVLTDLQAINEIRKVTAHFKPPTDPMSVHMRLNAKNGFEQYGESLNALLQSDAENALATAVRVMARLSDLPWGHATSET